MQRMFAFFIFYQQFCRTKLSMPKVDHDTKDKILRAAEKVFHRHGLKGARTGMIAEEAGISRTMLHYYFSTKEALFQEVLNDTMQTVLARIKQPIRAETSLEKVVENLITVLSDLFVAKPSLPSFVINLLNEAPELFLFAMQEDDLPRLFDRLMLEGKAQGRISKDLSGEDLLLNTIAVCSMPYLGATYIAAKEGRDEVAMQAFWRERKEKNLRFVLSAMRP
jgi:TetR/AcrR family transcriptional regulator